MKFDREDELKEHTVAGLPQEWKWKTKYARHQKAARLKNQYRQNGSVEPNSGIRRGIAKQGDER